MHHVCHLPVTEGQLLLSKDYDFTKMKEKDFERYFNFVKKVDNWADWAKKAGYLQGYQQRAMSDYYLLMFEAAKMNMPIEKNMTEHFFCYAIAKVLFNQIQEYSKLNPEESKYDVMYWCFATFEFFGDYFIDNGIYFICNNAECIFVQQFFIKIRLRKNCT